MIFSQKYVPFQESRTEWIFFWRETLYRNTAFHYHFTILEMLWLLKRPIFTDWKWLNNTLLLSFELMVKFLGLKAMKSAIYCQVWTSNYLQEIRTMAMMIPIIPRPRNPPMMLVIKRCLNNNILFTMLQCKFYKSFCLQDRDAILFRNSLLIGLYQVMYQFVLRYQLLKIFPVL